jgi:hypothetical protein
LVFYGFGTQNIQDGPLTSFSTTPLNPVTDVQATGVLTFQRTTRPGDSGGGYFRLNPTTREYELVALHVGRDFYANDRYEVRGVTRGNHEVAVATTITEGVFNQLTQGADGWRNANTGFFAPVYPTADEHYPNGAENQTHNHYPTNGEAGPSVPTHGHDDINGYFVIDFPVRNVHDDDLPGPGTCG